MDINGPCVMVALNGEHSDVGTVECLLYSNGDVVGCISNFKVIITPHVMRRIVTGPKEHVGLNLVTDVLKHVLKSSRGQITLVCTPISGSPSRIRWESILSSAAKESTTFRVSSRCILEINVRV